MECLTSFEALELAVKEKRHAWKTQRARIEQQINMLEEELNRLERKRRLYSWQQAEGIITEEELLIAYKQIKSEESVINEQLSRLEQFKREPAPPDIATLRKLADYWSWEITGELRNTEDDVRARFAETFDLRVTVCPDNQGDGYHLNLSANIPLETEGSTSAYDIVFSPSRGG